MRYCTCGNVSAPETPKDHACHRQMSQVHMLRFSSSSSSSFFSGVVLLVSTGWITGPRMARFLAVLACFSFIDKQSL